jgi:CDP-glucose 4,6-dehydratase
VRSPVTTFESNIGGTWSLLEACRTVGRVEQVVIASSDKAYGVQPKLPYTEDSPLQGRFPYDASKSAADLIAQS